MRILYISGGGAQDYLCDMLFHGLRQLEGTEVVDVKRMWFMYGSEFQGEAGAQRKARLYGKGFSVYGLLGDDSGVDRDDLETKISLRYFDAIIYGMVWRCRDYLSLALQKYPPYRLAFVDGADHQGMVHGLMGRGLYFKRELNGWWPTVLPIQFAIPREHVKTNRVVKTKPLAFIDPRRRETYVYDDQTSYYADYATSLFGVTVQKTGWDALRHYEILANRCIPWFLDIETCPPPTLPFFPKYQLFKIKQAIEEKGVDYFMTNEGMEVWERYHGEVARVFERHCTTEALARYVLDQLVAEGRSGPQDFLQHF